MMQWLHDNMITIGVRILKWLTKFGANRWKIRYSLCEISHGIYVYALNDDVANGEPPHWLCQVCFDNNVKSILSYNEKTSLCSCRNGHGDIYVRHCIDYTKGTRMQFVGTHIRYNDSNASSENAEIVTTNSNEKAGGSL